MPPCLLLLFFLFLSVFSEGLRSTFSPERPASRGHLDQKDNLHERHLQYAMFAGYDPAIRPVKNFSEVVSVVLEVTVHKILDLNERDQTLAMNMWLTLVWRDFRLGWDQRKFKRRHTRAKLHQLWRPDVRLYNLAERTAGEGYREVNVVAFSNGTLQWIPPVVSRSLCPIDVFYFPFDVQLCALVYASGSYDVGQLEIHPRDTRPDLSEYLESGEWTLVDAFYRRRVLESSMMNQSFAGVVVYLCLQRRALYYFINVVTPCTCLNLLCLASFWAPCEETGKVGLTLATMLSYFLYVNNVSERLPRSYRIPILGIYLLGSMFLSVVAVIVAVVTVDIRSHGLQRASCRARLRWLRAAAFVNNVAFVASAALLCAGLLLLIYMACNTASFAKSMCSYYLEQGRGVEM